MKISVFITSIAFTLFLTDCHADETGMDHKIDGSSAITAKQSIDNIRAELSPTDLQKFNQSYEVVLNRFASSFMLGKLANVFSPDKGDKIDPTTSLLSLMNGKTPNDIIQMAASPNSGSEPVANAKTDEASLIDQPLTAQLNVPFNIDGIEILIAGIHIGKIQKDGEEFNFGSVPDEPLLLATVTLKNTTEGTIIQLQNAWGGGTIIDNFDNVYSAPSVFQYSRPSIKGAVSSQALKPGESVNDLMIFDTPLENAQKFTLACDPNFYRLAAESSLNAISQKTFKLDFARSDIK
jgi:hypothetical protein